MATTNLVNWVSDHYPILMEVRERSKDQSYGKKSIYREHYEDIWSSYEACKIIVRNEWAFMGGGTRENPVKHFQQAANNTLANLKIWSKTEFADRKKKQDQLINQLKHAKYSSAQRMNGDQIRRLENQINGMLMDEEIYWRHRSRA